MTKLKDLVVICRSKNAGPFLLTIDIVCDDDASYSRLKESGVITPALFSRLYQVPVADVQFTDFPLGRAFKATLPRLVGSGDVHDTDVYGAQQHAPLLDVEIPA